MTEPRSESRGDDADIHPYPGVQGPAGPGAESMTGGGDGAPDDVALPSEMADTPDNARADAIAHNRAQLDEEPNR